MTNDGPNPTDSSFITHPSSFVRRPHSHRHRDRPGHGVRRRGGQGGGTTSHVFRARSSASRCGRRAGRRGQSSARDSRLRSRHRAENLGLAVREICRSRLLTGRLPPPDPQPKCSPTETAYINAVLADKPLGYWPLNEPAGARKFLDRSGHGFHGYAMNKVMAGNPVLCRQLAGRGPRRQRICRCRPPR